MPVADESDEKAVAELAAHPMLQKYPLPSDVAEKLREMREAADQRPDRPSQFLRGAMYGLLNCYRAAGIDEHDWRPFGPDFDKAEWDYFSFTPPETLPIASRYRL